MKKTSYISEYRHLIRLGLPIIIAQVGLTLQGMVDTLMLGQPSATALAAAGVGNSFLVMGQLMGMGFCMAAVPTIGRLYSQRCHQDIAGELKSSLLADALHGLLICAIMYATLVGIPYIGVEEALLSPMRSYMLILIPTLLVMNLCTGMKTFFDCLTDTRTTMWIVLIGNAWNILWNWILIFGKLGFPEMGIEGAAWATAFSRVVMLALYILCFAYRKKYALYRSLWKAAPITRASLVQHNRLGWPIALQLCIELAAFSVCTPLLGRGGISWDATAALAAHQVGIQISSFIFMFYVGIGSAVSIRVAHYYGLGGWNGIRHSAHAGYHLIIGIGIIATTLVYVLRHHLTDLFVSGDDPELLATISTTVVAMVWPIIFYQVGDGMQACYVNALRGIGDVKKLLKYSFIAYGLVSIPCSFIFGILFDHGTVGIWWGFPIGLSLVGILFLRRFLWKVKTHGR